MSAYFGMGSASKKAKLLLTIEVTAEYADGKDLDKYLNEIEIVEKLAKDRNLSMLIPLYLSVILFLYGLVCLGFF